jgi:phosphatidylinositol glycan class P protein
MKRGPNPTEVYGFIGWFLTIVVFVVFLAWSLLPTSALQVLGITYYPSKYWAIALPCFFYVFVVFVQVCYQALNLIHCPPPTAFSSFEDEHSRRGLPEPPGIPEVTDIPINVVNRLMFGKRPQHGRSNSLHH